MTENNINAHCAVCGKGYHVCNSCQEQKSFKPWRSIVDTIEHYKIYVTISSYTRGVIDKETAQKELEQCDISDYKNFVPHIANAIEQILKSENKTIKNVVKKEDADVEHSEKKIVNSLVKK